jgi:LacI family repressor for deo operon, udp, cdd, tsx, nupC, and nupG
LPGALEVLSQQLSERGCPIACVENMTGRDDILVKTDDGSAFRAAVKHLKALGHRRIVHLSGPNHPISRSRNAIFLRMLAELGLPVSQDSLIPTHPHDWQDRAGIEAATHALLDRSPRPTAVICAGDAAAMIAMRVAQQRGFRVPGDLSVIGFGNFELGAHAYPPLTSIAQPFREMGLLATQRLIELISSGETALSNATSLAAPVRGTDELPAHLVVRESTAPPAL